MSRNYLMMFSGTCKMLVNTSGPGIIKMTPTTIILLICITAIRAQSSPKQGVATKQIDSNYRLHSAVIPSAYTITIEPYFDTEDDELSFTYDGQVSITIKTEIPNIRQIKLHSEKLAFNPEDVSVVPLSNASLGLALNSTNPLEFDEAFDLLTVNLLEALEVSVEYVLNIKYRGQLRTDWYGFYRTSYVENGVTKWLGATQLGLTQARKAFPCFDEPEYKATFTLIIDRSASYSPSLANTKMQNNVTLQNGRIRETFYPTPRMSTYLVAFLVSEFHAGRYYADASSGNEFGIWTRPEAVNQTAYAMDIGRRALDAMNNYTGVNYYSSSPYLKLDHVAVPDFSYSGMENWGLIKYREAVLLYDSEESSVISKQRIAIMLAHEIAHMWFGDLVTCHWWTDAWLHEGFASYFEVLLTAMIEPSLGLDEQFPSSRMVTGFSTDEVAGTAAMTNNEVNTPAEVLGHFSQISYSKAASVISMIQHWIGMEAFRYGINQYLTLRAFDTATPSDIYTSFQNGADLYNSLSNYPDHNVSSVMDSWVSKPGYPLVSVNVDFDTKVITVNQQRFYLNETVNSGELYRIPISFTKQSTPDFNTTKPVFVFDEVVSHSFVVDDLEYGWVIFNIQQTGFYRVSYNEEMWNIIAQTLKSENRTIIHRLNRGQIVGDIFALAMSNKINYTLAFNVLDFLENETEHAAWAPAIAGFTALRARLAYRSEIRDNLDSYILRLLTKALETLGFEDVDGERDITKRTRVLILDFACSLSEEGCVSHANSVFHQYKVDRTRIPPNQRPSVYCTALRSGTAEDYDLLWERFLTSNVENEDMVLLQSLGCTTTEDRVNRYLSEIINPETVIRAQFKSLIMASVLRNSENVEVALKYVQENLASFRNYSSLSTNLNTIIGAMFSREQLNMVEAFMTNCSSCTSTELSSMTSAIERVTNQFTWVENHQDDIAAALDLRSGSQLHVSSIVIFLVCGFVILILN